MEFKLSKILLSPLRPLFGDNYKAQAAKSLGVGLSSLYRKIDELDINTRRMKNPA